MGSPDPQMHGPVRGVPSRRLISDVYFRKRTDGSEKGECPRLKIREVSRAFTAFRLEGLTLGSLIGEPRRGFFADLKVLF